MDPEFGVDLSPSIAALQEAGLMPPVVGLHVQGTPGGEDEVIVVEVLTSSGQDAESDVARVLANVPHEIVRVDENSPRPNVDYIAAWDD